MKMFTLGACSMLLICCRVASVEYGYSYGIGVTAGLTLAFLAGMLAQWLFDRDVRGWRL
jgi:hypothetical protein